MKRFENIDPILEALGEEAAMQEFDRTDERNEHQFSKEYLEKKEKLLYQAKHQKKKRNWKPVYAAAAAALLVIIPTTVYAAQKVYSTFISKNGYELNVAVIPEETSSEETSQEKAKGETKKTDSANTSVQKRVPVKLTLDYLPDGVYQDEEMKYSYNNDKQGGFSFLLWGVDDTTTYKFPYTDDYQTIQVNGNEGIIITKAGDWSFNRELVIFFQEIGYIVECYVGADVSDEELLKVAQGVTLLQVSEEEADTYYMYEPVETEVYEDTTAPLPLDSDRILAIGETADYTSMYGLDGEEDTLSPGNVGLTIKDVKVYDSLDGFDQASFTGLDLSEFTDENGVLQAYDREEIEPGDGIDTLDEVINVETVNRKFVCLTVALENKTEQAINQLFVTPVLEFKQEEGSTLVPFSGNFMYDSFPVYMNPHGTSKSFYRIDLSAGETLELHVGYIVDEDFLDTLFVNIEGGDMSEDAKYVDIRQ